MTFQAKVRLILLVVSIVALLARSRSVTSRRQRPMWLALLALTIELFLLQQPVGALVDRVSGIRHLTVFLGGYCHMALTMIIWTVLGTDSYRNPKRRHPNAWRWWFAGTVAAVTLLALTVTALTDIPTRQRGLPLPMTINADTIGWLAYLLFVAVSSTDATIRLWRHLRVCSFPALRIALALFCIATSASLLYVIARLTSLVVDAGWVYLAVLLASMTYFLCFTLGCVTVLAGPLIGASIAWWQRRRLFLLWRSVTAAVPEVVFEECDSWWADFRRIRRNKIRLQRRVIEIHDAALTLREWVTPDQMAELDDVVASRGLTGELATAAVTVRWLILTSAAKTSGSPRTTDVLDIAKDGGADISSELRWLMMLRRAHSECTREPHAQVAAR